MGSRSASGGAEPLDLDIRIGESMRRSNELLGKMDALLAANRATLAAADSSIDRARLVTESVEIDLRD